MSSEDSELLAKGFCVGRKRMGPGTDARSLRVTRWHESGSFPFSLKSILQQGPKSYRENIALCSLQQCLDRIFQPLIACLQYLTDAEEQTVGVQPQLRKKTSLSWWNFIFLSLKVYKMTISRCTEAGDKVCQLLQNHCCRCAPRS